MLFKRMQGIYGEVVIPEIGLSIGTMGRWTLIRREDAPPGSGEWDLHAFFSYINKPAWDAGGWEKEVRITVGDRKSGQTLRVTPVSNGRTVLEDTTLLIEGANLDVIS